MNKDRDIAIPLREWRLENFKSVEQATVEFRPLTILVGPNSSGKSSLIQSILLIAQSLSGSAGGEGLSLNGTLVKLGSVAEVVSAQNPQAGFSIGGTLHQQPGAPGPGRAKRQRRLAPAAVESEGVVVRWDLEFKGAPKTEPGSTLLEGVDVTVNEFGLESVNLSAKRRRDPSPLPVEADLGKVPYGEDLVPGDYWGPSNFSEYYQGRLRFERRVEEGHGLVLRAVFPRGILVQSDSHQLFVERWMRWVTGPYFMFASHDRDIETVPDEATEESLDQEEFIERLVRELTRASERVAEGIRSKVVFESDALAQLARSMRAIPRTRLHDLEDLIVQRWGQGQPVLRPVIPEALSNAAEYVGWILGQSVHYLGPLRQAPQVIYSTAQTPRRGWIGREGELTAAALHAYKDTEVECPLHPEGSAPKTLGDALAYWLVRLGVASSVETESRGRLGLEMRVTDSLVSKPIDLINVGVGVSQLVPVIMQCLLARPGSIVLLEQPELHLHPAVQQRLADFLLACARTKRQLIVETHSEYLISRLRLRVAQDLSDFTREYIGFIFAERDDAGRTQYKSLQPSSVGGLEPEIPEGFFDQSPRESQEILKAAVAKKRQNT